MPEEESKPKKLVKKKSRPATKKQVKKTAKNKASASKKPEPVLREEKRAVRPQQKKGKGTIYFLFIAVVIFVIAASWFQSQQLSQQKESLTSDVESRISTEVSKLQEKLSALTKELATQREVDEVKDENKLISYQVEQLDLQFNYPAQLGDVAIEENEGLLKISFGGNPDIWIIAAQADYEGEESFVYLGDDEAVTEGCEEPLNISETGYCDNIYVLDALQNETTTTFGDGALLNVIKQIRLNLDHETYKGLSINLGLGLPPVATRSIFKPLAEGSEEEALSNFFRNLVKGDDISVVIIDNLNSYKAILNSLTAI